MIDLAKYIRDVPDFPKQGIVFKDITPLLGNPQALRETVDRLVEPYVDAGIDAVVGVESRGFIFGALAAERMNVGFVPVRKAGKLPAETISESYELEYGTGTIEIHADAVAPGGKVLMVDDLLATGGTLAAACRLMDKLGAEIVGVAVVIELAFLNGRAKLGDLDLHVLMQVDGE